MKKMTIVLFKFFKFFVISWIVHQDFLGTIFVKRNKNFSKSESI